MVNGHVYQAQHSDHKQHDKDHLPPEGRTVSDYSLLCIGEWDSITDSVVVELVWPHQAGKEFYLEARGYKAEVQREAGNQMAGAF